MLIMKNSISFFMIFDESKCSPIQWHIVSTNNFTNSSFGYIIVSCPCFQKFSFILVRDIKVIFKLLTLFHNNNCFDIFYKIFAENFLIHCFNRVLKVV